MDHNQPCPVVTFGDQQLADEINEPLIKLEVNDDEAINPIRSEIMDEPNLGLSSESQSTVAVVHFPTEPELFECTLCSTPLPSDAQLKIHVRFCALYHEDRNRFCAPCNRKFSTMHSAERHRVTFHGTEEEKSSLYKFKCHLCPRQYRDTKELRLHLETHKDKKQQVESSNSKLPKCSHPNCGKQFRRSSDLNRHIDTIHSDIRPFKCLFPNCNKTFKQKGDMKRHVLIHTRKRPLKYTVDNRLLTNVDRQIPDEMNEPSSKVKVNDEDPIIPCSSEVIDEPHLSLFEPKSELITYESEINPDTEDSFIGFEQPKPNPYVLLKRLTSEEIQRACILDDHSTLSTFERRNLGSSSEPRYSFDTDSIIIDHIVVEKSTEIQSTAPVEPNLQFECKLCSKQRQSDAKLKLHVGICALYHEDRNRFCVTCNRKFFDTRSLKDHQRRFHGTEEEKLCLYNFKCRLCPKKYREACDLSFHLESHKNAASNINDYDSEVKKSKILEIQAAATTATVELDLQFECKCCGNKLQSDAELKIHVGICALYHRNRNRFCILCNTKLSDLHNLKCHRLKFHGIEEEKLSRYKYKCHMCPKKYKHGLDLKSHLMSHKEKKVQYKTSKPSS